MPNLKRRLWLQMSGEPVCRLFALWRRERDDARFCGTDPADRTGSAARLRAAVRAARRRRRTETALCLVEG